MQSCPPPATPRTDIIRDAPGLRQEAAAGSPLAYDSPAGARLAAALNMGAPEAVLRASHCSLLCDGRSRAPIEYVDSYPGEQSGRPGVALLLRALPWFTAR